MRPTLALALLVAFIGIGWFIPDSVAPRIGYAIGMLVAISGILVAEWAEGDSDD